MVLFSRKGREAERGKDFQSGGERTNPAHRRIGESERRKKDKDDWTWRGRKELRTVQLRKNETKCNVGKKVRKMSGAIIWRP